MLGKVDYGIVTYAFSWVFFFGSLSILGLNSVLRRELVKYLALNDLGKMKGLMQFSSITNLITTVMIASVFSLLVNFVLPIENETLKQAMLIAIWGLPVYGQLLIQQATCIGLKKVEYSMLPEMIIRPVIFLIVVFLVVRANDSIVINEVISYNIGSFGIALIAAFILYALFSKTKGIKASFEGKKWLKLGLTFFLLTAIVSINARADILMLGMFGETEKVGVYNIAVKFAQFVGLPLVLANGIIAPYISEMHESKMKELATLIKKVIRVVFLIGLIAMAVIYFAGEFILDLHGEGFIEGYKSMVILGAGHILNILFGPVGNILTMSKYEKLALYGMMGSTAINIILNVVLIPTLSIEGAAIATIVSLVFWNVILFVIVKKKLNINPSVI